MERKKVYFRTDASSEIGMGHFSRCIGLADILSEFLQPSFIMQKFTNFCKDLCEQKKYTFIPIENNINEREERDFFVSTIVPGSIIVLDGYHLSNSWIVKLFKNIGCKVVSIDDIHSHFFESDVVINHGGAKHEDYLIADYTKLYLGLDYAMVKREFIKASAYRQNKKAVNHILVSMGGTDPGNFSLKAAQWISEEQNDFTVSFLTTSANRNFGLLRDYCYNYDRLNVYVDLVTNEVIDLMNTVDLAVLPASTIAIEAALIGMGIICGTTVDNQNDMYSALLPAVISVGRYDDLSKHKFMTTLTAVGVEDVNNLISAQRKLLDGKSPERIKEIFKTLC